MKTVQTVLGPIDMEALGRTLIHEHIFIAFPGAEFDPGATVDRPAIIDDAVRKLRQLREEFGVQTFVDPCPIEMGRDPEMLAEISRKSGMNIVCTTGFYYEGSGLPHYWRPRSVQEIADLYIREITVGIGDTGIRAGAIKVATEGAPVTPLDRKFLDAACIAHLETGVPIITHTDGVSGPEQADAFLAGGVSPRGCLIGHSCGNPEHAYHRKIVDRGTYIGFDRIGMLSVQSDEVRADRLADLVKAGYGPQVMMSQDRYCFLRGKPPRPITAEEQARIAALRAEGKWLPYTHLFTDFFPKLRERGMTDDEIYSILDDNPKRFFSGAALSTSVER